MSKMHGTYTAIRAKLKATPTVQADRKQQSSGGPSASWRRLWAAKQTDGEQQQEEGERDE